MRRLRKVVPVAAGLALVVGIAGCDWPDGTRFVHEVFDEVDVTTDVAYRTTTTYDGRTITLRLDIHQPRGDTRSARPAIMWMHGGGWTQGNKSLMSGYATDSAERGYVGVTINYRLRDETSFDAAWDAYEDAVAAVEWLKAHAAQYRIDPDAIVAGGHSAGAFNALHLLYAPGDRGPAVSPVAGAVSLAGFSLAAPSAGDPPAIMLAGDQDTTVRLEWQQGTCNDARAAGAKCELIVYPGYGHLFPYQITGQVQTDLHHQVFDQVLWPLGYRVENLDTPAAAA